MKATAQHCGQFLVSSQVNYTGPYLADHLEGLTRDNVRCFLNTQRFTPRQLWQQVRPQLVLSARGCMAEMLAQVAPDGIAYRTVLMDCWYAATALVKWLLAAGKTHYCPLKTRFKRLGATASSTIPAASSPTSQCPACTGRAPRWKLAKP